MDNYDEELEKIKLAKEQREKELEEVYAKERAKSETNAITTIVTDTQKTLQTKLNTKLAEHIETNQQVAVKIEETADKLVDKGLKVQENEATAGIINSEDKVIEADYNKNKNEYLYHGINHKIDKEWKRKLLMIINDIWFIIWAIVSCFTLVPISTFLSRIGALKGFMKGVATVIGIILLLGCLAGLTFFVLKWSGVIQV